MRTLGAFVVVAMIAAAIAGPSGKSDPCCPPNLLAQHEGHKMPAKTSKAQVKQQHFTVTVNNMKYSPSTINVKAGKPVHLMFKLGPKAGCGDVLVIKRAGIKKQLMKGKTNAVSFTPKKPGKYPFTCGMGMMKGTIVAK